VLIEHLPPESALARGGDPWEPVMHLVADITETVDKWGRVHAMQWGDKPEALGEAVSYPRHGQPEPERRNKSVAAMRALMQQKD
jgi:hypothetical protein